MWLRARSWTNHALCDTIVVTMIVESVRTVKARFSEFLDLVVLEREQVTITRNGRPEAVLISLRELESMQATIEYLSDPEAIAAVKRGRRDIAAGRVIDEAGIEALRLELEARRDRKTLDASDV
jgi:prevent-host-death family protein